MKRTHRQRAALARRAADLRAFNGTPADRSLVAWRRLHRCVLRKARRVAGLAVLDDFGARPSFDVLPAVGRLLEQAPDRLALRAALRLAA